MKNIVVCSTMFDTSLVGGYHFPHQILELNNQLDTYRIWLLTEDLIESKRQRNENLDTHIRKVHNKYPFFLFPFTHFIHNWIYYRAIRRFQKEKQVDIIIFSQACYGVLTRILLPRSIIITGLVHDTDSLICDRKSHFSLKSLLFHQLTKRPLEITANYIFDYTIANSEYIRQLILTKRKLPTNKVLLLLLSIDVWKIPFQKTQWTHTKEETVKILFIKLDFVRGGLEDLINALGTLPYHFHLTIVGPDVEVLPKIEAWSALFLNISLNFRGALNANEVLTEMSSNHILCIPSRNEALGLANVEGLATGISVVSTRVGGIPEVLDGGNCGWLAEPRNPSSLAAALQNCIECSPTYRLEKTQYGRAHVEQLFSKEIMLSNVIKLLDKIANA